MSFPCPLRGCCGCFARARGERRPLRPRSSSRRGRWLLPCPRSPACPCLWHQPARGRLEGAFFPRPLGKGGLGFIKREKKKKGVCLMTAGIKKKMVCKNLCFLPTGNLKISDFSKIKAEDCQQNRFAFYSLSRIKFPRQIINKTLSSCFAFVFFPSSVPVQARECFQTLNKAKHAHQGLRLLKIFGGETAFLCKVRGFCLFPAAG